MNPDIRTPKEAGAYLRKLHLILKYIDVCDGNMEQGSFRCDANISLRKFGKEKFGTRTELKNLNSFKNVEKAIAYEIQRQTYVLEKGEKVIQETRLWNPEKNLTSSMRNKEEAHDYRYFPDPDLVPLIVDDKWINKIKKNIPELPDKKQKRFIKEYLIPDYDVNILTSSRELADYFEETAKDLNNKKQVSNWIMGNILGLIKEKGVSISDSPVSSKALASLLKLIEDGKINSKGGKAVFDEMILSDKSPEQIVKEKGLEQVSDQTEIKNIVLNIIDSNPKELQAYQNGKTKLFSFFMGQIMREAKNKADPKIVAQLLKKYLAK